MWCTMRNYVRDGWWDLHPLEAYSARFTINAGKHVSRYGWIVDICAHRYGAPREPSYHRICEGIAHGIWNGADDNSIQKRCAR